MKKLMIVHSDDRTEVHEVVTDSFSILEEIYPDLEIDSSGTRYWIEDVDVTAYEFED